MPEDRQAKANVEIYFFVESHDSLLSKLNDSPKVG